MRKLQFISCFAILFYLIGCAKTEDYKKYLESGEIRYAAKPEKLKALSGKDRIKLQWVILSDQNITKAKIFWRNKTDSLEVAIKRTSGIDTISKIIPLSEGPYSFDVIHYHEDGVKSLASNVSGNVYGESFLNTLMNRGTKSYTFLASNKSITINWGVSDNISIGTQVNYTNVNNQAVKAMVTTKAVSSNYTNVLNNSVLEYRTLYKPDTLCIDTFYTDFNRINIKY